MAAAAATAAGGVSRTVRLLSSDMHVFEVPEDEAAFSQTVKNLVEDVGTDDTVALPNVDGATLGLVLAFCKQHAAGQATDEWTRDFLSVDQKTLFDVIIAANYMNVKPLLDAGCRAVADLLRGKSPEEIRTILNLQNDLTPEEEEAVRRENSWAFD